METHARKAGGRPTRERAAGIDDLLLDGARSLFGRKGVAATSVDEIAIDLGISKHTIYRRYPNKGALLEAVVERDIRQFKTALTSAATGIADPLEAVRRTALRYFEIGSSRDYAAFYLSVSAEAAFSPALRHRLAAWSETTLAPLVDVIASAQAAGLLLPGDPAATCEILVDLLEGANNRVRLRADGASDVPEPDKLFEARWTIFLRACGRAS
ncbi:TetR/AcrR family transcriptional regulator [Edaphosphingomonas haloaromaticamans]|uniref:Bacterial regulatory protein, tetR family n=1 Tax=Edaphosphingomonas haloaromaticamans TaxID=653954 RepID=A0A1S1HB97_9SPHN|nr:TetR/AcrR family transcriptional regulator [Sphingomonas haloaromaticamans]OHT19358.1 Bacterial regulatory protein, tetR family [Sphingomonas haloaromaticamans]